MFTTKQLLTLAIAATAGVTATTRAATLVWDGGGANQFFGIAENWDLDQVPTSGDDVFFPGVAVAPLQTPMWEAADSVNSISVDNSGGFVWQLPRSGSANPRSITIGGGGLSITGGGITTWGAVTTSAGANQNWMIGAGTTLSFATGATIGGSGKITKTGDGTIVLPNATNTNSGGYDIMAGTIANSRSTQGAGTGAVTIFDGGTYEARNASINSSPIVIKDGGRLLGTGASAGIAGTSITIDSAANAVMEIGTASAGDVFALTPAVSGGDATSVVEITGPGRVTLLNGSDSASAFAGTWRVSNGILRANAANSLGNRSGTPSLTNVQNPSTVQLNGGTVWFGGTNSTSTAINFNNPIFVTADSGIAIDKLSAGTVVNNNGAIARVLGAVTIGGNTLNVSVTSNVTGPTTPASSSFVRIGGGAVNLTGNATFNVIKPTGFDLTFVTSGVSDGGNGHGFTKTGTGAMTITGAGSYTGPTSVLGGTLFVNHASALGSTSSLHVGSGATVSISTTNYTSTADLSGSGTISIGNTLTLNGSAVAPGSSAGILNISGSVALTGDSSLVIEVLNAGDTAGVDYDQLALTAGLMGIGDTNLIVDLSGVTGDLSGKTLTIVTAATNFTGQQFESVIFSSSWLGTVNYLNGSITLSDLALVPEPASFALLAMGGGVMLARRRA